MNYQQTSCQFWMHLLSSPSNDMKFGPIRIFSSVNELRHLINTIDAKCSEYKILLPVINYIKGDICMKITIIINGSQHFMIDLGQSADHCRHQVLWACKLEAIPASWSGYQWSISYHISVHFKLLENHADMYHPHHTCNTTNLLNTNIYSYWIVSITDL